MGKCQLVHVFSGGNRAYESADVCIVLYVITLAALDNQLSQSITHIVNRTVQRKHFDKRVFNILLLCDKLCC